MRRRALCLSRVSQVDEIFGTIQEVFFSVKAADGISATSFKVGDKLFINPEKLLPLQRFLPQPKGAGGGKGIGKGAPTPTPRRADWYPSLRSPH